MEEISIGYEMNDRRDKLVRDRRNYCIRYENASKVSKTVMHCLNQVTMSIPVFLGKLEARLGMEVLDVSKKSVNAIVAVGRKAMLYNNFFEVQAKINQVIINGSDQKVLNFNSLLNERAIYQKQIINEYGQEEFDYMISRVMKKGRRKDDIPYISSLEVANLFASSLRDYVEQLRIYVAKGEYGMKNDSPSLFRDLEKLFNVYDNLLIGVDNLTAKYDKLLTINKDNKVA